MRRFLPATILSCLFCLGAPALAQDVPTKPPPIELTATQIDTNNQAVRLLGETPPKTQEAIKLVEAALLTGDKGDLLYLTLGRAYQLAGQCAKAEEQFFIAEQAPGVKGVPPEFVPGRLTEYRAELESCMGTLRVTCEPADLALSLDGEALACDTDKEVEPGTYTIDVQNTYTQDTLSLPVQVRSGEETITQVKLGKAAPAGGGGEATLTPPPQEIVEPHEEGGVSWRVSPYLGVGTFSAALEPVLINEMPVRQEDAFFYGSNSLLGALGAEGRVLFGSPDLRYGAGFDARLERGLTRFGEVSDESPALAYGVRFLLHGQLWIKQLIGFYAGFQIRPRGLALTPFSSDFIGLGAGGGLRIGLGELIGLSGLELYGGYYGVFAGEPESTSAIPLDSSPTLPIEAGLRLQLGSFTTGFVYEGWHDEASTESDAAPAMMGGARTPQNVNLRAQQFLFTLGWTFGN